MWFNTGERLRTCACTMLKFANCMADRKVNNTVVYTCTRKHCREKERYFPVIMTEKEHGKDKIWLAVQENAYVYFCHCCSGNSGSQRVCTNSHVPEPFRCFLYIRVQDHNIPGQFVVTSSQIIKNLHHNAATNWKWHFPHFLGVGHMHWASFTSGFYEEATTNPEILLRVQWFSGPWTLHSGKFLVHLDRCIWVKHCAHGTITKTQMNLLRDNLNKLNQWQRNGPQNQIWKKRQTTHAQTNGQQTESQLTQYRTAKTNTQSWMSSFLRTPLFQPICDPA